MLLDEYRRRERAHFLRKRRENVSPTDVGLPEGARRRTPGLRREEVAVLAGVSPTWYTYLEQARDVSPSPDVLDGLADVLRLTPDERVYLHGLSRQTACQKPAAGRLSDSWKSLENVASHMLPSPAYICSAHGDLLSWNSAVAEWFTDFEQVPAQERNILIWMFTSAKARDCFVDWEEQAQHSIARFRAETTDWLDSPHITSLVTYLSKVSSHFRLWWEEHRVAGPAPRNHCIHHPRHGVLTVQTVELLHLDPTGTAKLVVHTPLSELPTPAVRQPEVAAHA
ncbi:helix-turn-helix transcriptional regulator [Streptomyces sp. NPDC050315]|uniref:helix-turn-helix transcriptional regulator n=1 Tax=Streptomyces sp. NPDC050315 TaxID=3155039 RepID=UPI003413FC09